MVYDGPGEGPEGAKDRTHFTLKPLGPGQKYSFRIRVGHTHRQTHVLAAVLQYSASLADPHARSITHCSVFVGASAGACTPP